MTDTINAGRRHLFSLGLAASAVTGLSVFAPAKAANSGIGALIALTQQKSQQANEEALGISDNAERQRKLVESGDTKAAAKLIDDQLEKARALLKTQKEIDASLEELADAAAKLNCK